MISILYSERDYEAANIALKVQSLSQSQPTKIYIVPKHYGRNEEVIAKNLNKTKAAIFLAHDSKKIDNVTFNELALLQQKKIPIKYIVPDGFNVALGANKNKETAVAKIKNEDIYRYSLTTNKSELINSLALTVDELKLQTNTKNKKKDSDVEAFIGILIVLVLSILLSEKSTSKK